MNRTNPAARDGASVAEPERRGFYLTKEDPSDSQDWSWYKFKKDLIPLSNHELGRLLAGNKSTALNGVGDILLALPFPQQHIISSIVAELQKGERSDARWVVSCVDRHEGKDNSGNAICSLILIVERVWNATLTTAESGTIVNTGYAASKRTRKEEQGRVVEGLVKKAFDDSADPQSSIVRSYPRSRHMYHLPDEAEEDWSDTPLTQRPGPRLPYVRTSKVLTSEDELDNTRHDPRESVHGVQTPGARTRRERQTQTQGKKKKHAVDDDQDHFERRTRFVERASQGAHEESVQHDPLAGGHHDRGMLEKRYRSAVSEVEILKELLAKWTQMNMRYEQMALEKDTQSYQTQRMQYPHPDVLPSHGKPDFNDFRSTYLPQAHPQYPAHHLARYTMPPAGNPSAYSNNWTQLPQPIPLPSTQHHLPSQFQPIHSPRPYASQTMSYQPIPSLPNVPPVPYVPSKAGRRPSRSHSPSFTVETMPSPPSKPLALSKGVNDKNVEIETLKARLTQQIEVNIRREQMDRQREVELAAQKAEESQAKRDAERQALHQVQLDALKSVIKKHEEDRDTREAAWRREREAEAIAKATIAAKAEEEKRQKAEIDAAIARAEERAEKKAAEASKEAQEQYAKNLWEKTLENKRLQFRLAFESKPGHEQAEIAGQTAQEAVMSKKRTDGSGDKTTQSRSREASRYPLTANVSPYSSAKTLSEVSLEQESTAESQKKWETTIAPVADGNQVLPQPGDDAGRETPSDDIPAPIFETHDRSSEHEMDYDRMTIGAVADHVQDQLSVNTSVSELSRDRITSHAARAPSEGQSNGPDEVLEASLIHMFSSECYRSLDLHSAQAWFEDDGAIVRSECLIRDFVTLLQTRDEEDGEHTKLLDLIFQKRSDIIAQLKDKVFSKIHVVDTNQDSNNRLLTIDERSLPASFAASSSNNLTQRLKALFQTANFRWITQHMESRSLFSETDTTASDNRFWLARNIAVLSTQSSLRLSLQWDPLSFLSQQYSADQNDLTGIIVYCGLASTAYATTAGKYISAVWAQVGSFAIECVQAACESSSRQAQLKRYGLSLEVQLMPGKTLVCISPSTDNIVGILEIAEACVWLATACRENHLEECLAYSSAEFTEADNEPGHLEIRERLQNVEGEGSQDGLCWSKMVKNPVVAQGYPVPKRHHPVEQVGLEISLDMMIALSHAYWATTFEATFILKGLICALVPILEVGSSLIWHFMLNEDGSRMTYQQACASASEPSIALHGKDDLQGRRHFVGVWSRSARIMAGGNDANLYDDLQLSSSKPVDQYTISVSNVSLTAGQYLTAGGAFKIAKKDTAPLLQKTSCHAYGVHVQYASNMSVVFYGTHDRRGWLLDGASALMHLARSWLSCREHPRIAPSELEKLTYRDQRGGRASAIDALAKNQYSDVSIFEDLETRWEDSQKIDSGLGPPSSSDSGYYSSNLNRKERHKRIISVWSFKELVLHLWHIMETMHDKLHSSKFGPPEFSAKPSPKLVLTGWETRDILTKRGPFESRRVELKATAGRWLQYVKEQSAIVLLARTFGDMILPEEGTSPCSRFSKMPMGYDFLAVPFYVLLPEAQRFLHDYENDSSEGCTQITDYTYWYSDVESVHSCPGAPTCTCQIISTMSHKPKKKGKSSQNRSNIFDRCPEGVAIIGSSKPAKKSLFS